MEHTILGTPSALVSFKAMRERVVLFEVVAGVRLEVGGPVTVGATEYKQDNPEG